MISQTLKSYFGFDSFRPGQEPVVQAVVNGQSCAAIFPTGSGKSLCYQLPALHLPHLTLVISPLLALMKDQLDFLQAKNIPAARIDSSQSREEGRAVMGQIKSGQIKILMISVERLKNERFRQFISQVPISLLVVDEAHCISEWGHNFRPDYLKLPEYQSQLNIPQALLLTATATPKVVQDMRDKFAIAPENVVQTGFYRANLKLLITGVGAAEKNNYLINWLQPRQGQAGIVYVTLQKTAEQVAAGLTARGLHAVAYHAGLTSETRETIQADFMAGRVNTIVATIAFGMGIDKSNIRYVVHYDLPKSIENYSQEIGRAGRDGQPSECLVLGSKETLNVLENFVYGDTPELAGITQVLTEIKQAGGEWEFTFYALSSSSNVRQLPLKTLLVYLEIMGIIKPKYSYFAEYRFKFLVSEADILARFPGERQAFLNSLFASLNRARVWNTVDFGQLAQIYPGDRSRVTKALEYFHEQQLILLESKQMTEVFQVLTPEFDSTGVAEQLHRQFKDKELAEINRIQHMVSLFQSGSCLSQQLAHYFGDNQLQQACGHCAVCLGSITVFPEAAPLNSLQQQDLSALTRPLREKGGEPISCELITRFLCGISTPWFTKIKARSMSGFGALENYRYDEVEAWVGSQRPNI